jgi:hypothetical protein
MFTALFLLKMGLFYGGTLLIYEWGMVITSVYLWC